MSGSDDVQAVILGTRGSKLALAQAEIVRAALVERRPGLQVQIEVITTRGDVVQDRPLSEVGGNGVFVRGIEAALQDGRIDMAVHSAKDLPSELGAGMTIAAYLPRADARDVLVSRHGESLRELRPGAIVGTSSPRRACFVRAMRPDVVVEDIRGNVDTRLRKLGEGRYDAIVLAAAGLVRLGLGERASEWLDPEVMVPAVGQGALAIEVRESDGAAVALAASLNDAATFAAVAAERAFLAALGGGCSLPIAAHATLDRDGLRIVGMIGSADKVIKGERVGSASDVVGLGRGLAADLLEQGGREPVRKSEAEASALPLSSKRVAVTRASEQAEGLTRRLEELGAKVLECPAITIAPLEDYRELDEALGKLGDYDWVIFTSVNGVLACAGRLIARGIDPDLLCSRRLGAIGPATAAALRTIGCVPQYVPDTFVAEALVEQIGDIAGCRILLPRADIARKALAEGLSGKGGIVDEVTAYRTVRGEGIETLLEALRSDGVDAITFTSSSTVRYTVEGLVGAGLEQQRAVDLLSKVNPVCIGPITAATAEEFGIKVAVTASEYTADGVANALIELFGAKDA